MARKRSLLLASILIAVSGVGYSYLWNARKPQVSEPPTALIKQGAMAGTAAKAAQSDLRSSYHDWDTLKKLVTVKRRERLSAGEVWDEQVQELSASFFILDVRWVCGEGDQIKKLFVAGVYPGGDACLEQWKFTYKLGSPEYVPISQRALPSVTRSIAEPGSRFH